VSEKEGMGIRCRVPRIGGLVALTRKNELESE